MQLLCCLALALAPAQEWENIGPRSLLIGDGAISPVTDSVFATQESFVFRQRSGDAAPFTVLTFPGSATGRGIVLARDGGVFARSGTSLLRSDDDGATFVDVTPPLAPGTFISEVALSPSDAERIWVGAFPPSSGGPQSPPLVFTSADGGATWNDVTPAAQSSNTGVAAIGVDRADGARAVVSLSDGLLRRTEDAGTTWSTGAPLDFVDDLAVDGQTVLAAGFLAAYHSSDFGATMTESLDNGSPFFTQVTGVEIDSAGVAYFMTEFMGLYRSTDGGVNLELTGGAGESYLRGDLSLDGMDRPVIAMRDVGVIRIEGTARSYWPGAPMHPTGFPLPVEAVAAPTVLPDRLASLVAVGLTLGDARTILYTSLSGGATWTPRVELGNAPLTALHDGNGDLLVGASVEGGGPTEEILLAEASAGFQAIGPPLAPSGALRVDARAVAVDPSDPARLAVAVEILSPNGIDSEVEIHSSVDRGASWRLEASTGLASTSIDVKLVVTFDPITGDASGHLSTVRRGSAAGLHEVTSGPLWRSSAGSWTVGVTGFGVGQFSFDPQPSLFVGGSPASRVYTSRPLGTAATRAVLFSDDGGGTWVSAGTDQPQGAFHAASPNNAETVFRYWSGVSFATSLDGGFTFVEAPGSVPGLGSDPGGLSVDGDDNLYAFGVSMFRRRADSIGQRFCSPAPVTSTGFPARLTMTGPSSVAMNDLEFDATGVPASAFGIAVASAQTQPAAPLMNSEGMLCLGTPFVRFVDSVQNSGPAGRLRRPIDLTTLAALGMTAPIAAGDTWSFQAWFRDVDASGSPTSNLSDGVTVTFTP